MVHQFKRGLLMAESQKSNKQTTTADDLVELAGLAFDAMSKPGIAEGLKEIADREGVTLDIVRDTLVAMTLRHLGQPVPPELRERVMTNFPNLEARLRDMIMKPDLN
jgi:hypothetical protein